MSDLYGTAGIALHVLHVTVKRDRIKHASDHIPSIQKGTLHINVLCSGCNRIQVPRATQIGTDFSKDNVWIGVGEFSEGFFEELVVECDEDDVETLTGEFLGVCFADTWGWGEQVMMGVDQDGRSGILGEIDLPLLDPVTRAHFASYAFFKFLVL